MLAGERFGDRPISVCPVIGAIMRAYNDNVDDRRRQDLYRFAADAVDTRRDFRVQRRRADAALDWAWARYQGRGSNLLGPPDPEGPRDEIGYYVVGAISARGGRWSDEEHGAMIALLEELLAIDRESALEVRIEEPLVGDLLEEIAQPLEHRGGHHEFLLAEGLQCGTEARLEARPPFLDQAPTAVGERCEDDAPVVLRTPTQDEVRRLETVQHLGDARRAQIGGLREVARGHLAVITKAEQQAVLRIGELARTMGLASAHPSHGGHRSLERSRDLLGGIAVLALAYHVAKRR